MQISRFSISTILLTLVAACGGAGGDNGFDVTDNAAIEALAPFVGIWDLPGDWSGSTGDEAFLVIRSPNTDGISDAIIYDLDDAVAGAERNCHLTDDRGELSQSLNDELFLDLPVYSSAIAALLPNGELEISVFNEGASSGTPPQSVFTATRETSISENDLPICDN